MLTQDSCIQYMYMSNNKQCFTSWRSIGSTSHEASRTKLRYFRNICVRYEVILWHGIPATRGEDFIASTGQKYFDERCMY